MTRAELHSRASVMQSRVSWHQLIQCLQSLAPVSSHPLRPGAHYAGPSFPPVLCSALYICTVYYVCNGVGLRASCQWPSSVDNITQLGSVSGTRAAVSITSCQEQHRDPSRSSWWHPGHPDQQEPLWSPGEPLLPLAGGRDQGESDKNSLKFNAWNITEWVQHKPVKITITNCQQGKEINNDWLKVNLFDVAWQNIYTHPTQRAGSRQSPAHAVFTLFNTSLEGEQKV